MNKKIVEVGSEYGAEYAGTYIFQELTWAKRSRIIQKYTKYHPISGQVVSSDFIAIQAETIWAALKQQPPNNPLTFEKLAGEEIGIPIGLGELLSKIANNLCSLNREDATFLSEPSNAKSPTPQLQNSDYAKNSDGLQPSLPSNQQKQSSSLSSSSTK